MEMKFSAWMCSDSVNAIEMHPDKEGVWYFCGLIPIGTIKR